MFEKAKPMKIVSEINPMVKDEKPKKIKMKNELFAVQNKNNETNYLMHYEGSLISFPISIDGVIEVDANLDKQQFILNGFKEFKK